MNRRFFAMSLCASLCLAVRAADPAQLRLSPRAGDPASPHPLAPFGRVETDTDTGAETLLIDTMRGGVWNPCFRTAPSVFQPGDAYEISFRYTLEEKGDGAYLLLLLRPEDAPNHLRDAASFEVYDPPRDGIVRFRVKVPDSGPKSNPAFQIHTFRGLRASVSDLRIRSLEHTFASAETDIGAPSDWPDPTGAGPFEVERPRLDRATTYFVPEHGISTNAADNSAAFQALLWKARKGGPARIVFEQGRYRFGDAVNLLLDTTFDMEIDGRGSTFVFCKKAGNLLNLHHCERIALKNLSIDWDWEADPLASHVVVADKAPDGTWIDLRFRDYDEFPRRDVRLAYLALLNPETRFMPIGGGYGVALEFFVGKKEYDSLEWTGPATLRVRASAAKLEPCRVGDLLLARHYVYDMTAVNLLHTRHVSFENVHILSAPGMGILASGTVQYWEMLHCSVHPAEGSDRPVGTTADSIHAGSTCGYLRFVDVRLGGGGDDTLNLHDGSCLARKIGPRTLLTLNHNNLPGNYFWKGHPVEFREDDFTPVGLTARLAAVRRSGGQYELEFEEDLPDPKGTAFLLFNRRYGTHDVEIRDCVFDRFPRGILLMADNATVEGCRFDLGMAGGIKIESGYTMKVWSEGYGASNVVVRGNTFRSVNLMGRYDYEGRPDIFVSSYRVVDPSMDKARYPLLRDLLFENNRFEGTLGAPIFLGSAGNVIIRKNVFDLRAPAPTERPLRGALAMVSTTNVEVSGNTWILPPKSAVAGVSYEEDSVIGLRLHGNRVTHDPPYSHP